MTIVEQHVTIDVTIVEHVTIVEQHVTIVEQHVTMSNNM